MQFDWKGIANAVVSALLAGATTAGSLYYDNPDVTPARIGVVAGVSVLGALVQHFRRPPAVTSVPKL